MCPSATCRNRTYRTDSAQFLGRDANEFAGNHNSMERTIVQRCGSLFAPVHDEQRLRDFPRRKRLSSTQSLTSGQVIFQRIPPRQQTTVYDYPWRQVLGTVLASALTWCPSLDTWAAAPQDRNLPMVRRVQQSEEE